MQMNSYSEITPEILNLAQMSERASQINADLYKKYDVKRGLRDINGKGVLAGLTEIGEVQAYKNVDGKEVPCEGKLYYRGLDIEELVKGYKGALDFVPSGEPSFVLRGLRKGFSDTKQMLSGVKKLLNDIKMLIVP